MDQERKYIAAAQKGDADAFEQLVLLYQGKMYHLALRMCGNSSDAEEAVQEAFLSAWKHLPSFRGEAAFSTWLHRLTVNACNDIFRRQKSAAGNVALDDEESALQIPDYRYQPEDEAERRELRESVREALLELSPEHREVLLLRELQQQSYDEIARILQLDLGTVKSRIHRGRSQLREILIRRGTFWTDAPSKDMKKRKKEDGT